MSVQISKIFLSNLLLLSTSHAVLIGTAWSDLKPIEVDKRVDGTGVAIKGREITLTEDAILNLTTITDPILEGQYYGGDLKFDGASSLTLNIDVSQANAGGLTPIYWRKKAEGKIINSFTCGKYTDSDGSCVVNLNIDSTKTIAKHIVNMEASTLILSSNVNVTLAQDSRVHSLFVAGVHGAALAEGTIEFMAGLNVDLRNTQGEFEDLTIGEKRSLIFENFGAAINVNPDRRPFSVKLYGDIYTEGLGTRINLVTPDSIFEGHIDIGNASYNSFTALTLQNGATANIELQYLTPTNANIQSFSLSLQDSSAKLEATLGQTQNAQTNLTLINSTLYANFNYTSPNRGGQDKTSVELNQSTWITNKNAYADEVTFGNNGVIDLRYSDFNGTLRSFERFDVNNRITLNSKLISGNSSGVFRLYGIFNRDFWSKDTSGNTIATDQIITEKIQGNHFIEIYWNPDSFDQDLFSQDLVGDRIVVARQLSTANEGNFIGGITSVGLYSYKTNLLKEELTDNTGTQIGYEWVIGKLDEAQASVSRPSFLSKTLNALYNIPYKTYISQTQTLHQRMGDLRHFDSVAGAYIKTNYSLLYSSQTSEEISAFTHIEDITLGGDFGIFGYGGKHFFGVAFNLTPIQDLGEEGAYSGNSLAYGFSLYHTSLLSSGFYTDTLLKYFFASHQYALYSQDFGGNNLDFSTRSLLGSFELGYRMRLPIKSSGYGFFYLKPQFGLDFGAIFGSGLMRIGHSSGYDVEAKYLMSFPITPSFSVDFGKRFDSESLLGDVFASVGMEYAFNAGNTLELNTPYNSGTFSPQGIFNLKLGVGGNVILMNGTRFYFDISSKFSGRIAPVLGISAGARIPIGAKHQRNLPSVDTPMIYGNARGGMQ
ncbi:autotransporter outer membrane beta-barrel domain-containing protein [Helicobacter brantae]|uniref:Autotransporter domain-containing protein n=1 Tax=Helicobacter brantae TaxID=375927 RepID=A0A3D8IZT8_9HELI|nr:autotransporter outer membrane beta-barrel domain-containing protein [Helicobacter brantae]RDU70758.1 hypothetical protein CQA58_04330 [Helicobacter brantae]